MPTKVRIIASIGFAAACSFLPLRAEACLCADYDATPDARVSSHSIVFAGQVVSARLLPKVKDWQSIVEYTFVPFEILKGNLDQKEFKVFTFGSSCDYAFQVGEKYLVFSNLTKDGKLRSHLCDGNRPIRGDTDPELKRAREFVPAKK